MNQKSVIFTPKELHRFIRKHIKTDRSLDYINAVNIAKSLGIVVKNSSDCLKDFGAENFLLTDKKSVYALYKQQHTIYYNEKNDDKNFSIATMIVAQLGWFYLAEILPIEICRLGAAMILVRDDEIIDDSMYSIEYLSLTRGIPLSYLQIYRQYVRSFTTAKIAFVKFLNMFKGIR